MPIAQAKVGLDRQLELTDLPPGAYDIQLEIGGWYLDRAPLGEAPVELIAGVTRCVTIEAKVPPTIGSARLSGLVTIGEGWELEGLAVYARLEGEIMGGGDGQHYLSRKQLWGVAGAERAYLFDFGELQLGEYTVGARSGVTGEDFDTSVTVQLGADGLTDITLEVQPACRVQITVTDSVSGEAVDFMAIWLDMSDSRRRGLRAIQSEPGEGACEFLSSVGEFQLITTNPEYRSVREVLTVGPGLNRFHFQVMKACRVRISLRNGELSLPWIPELQLELNHVDSGEGIQTWTNDGGARLFSLIEPGRYRIASFHVEGFKAVEGIEFDALAGEITECIIALKRE